MKAHLEDLNELVSLEAACFPDPWSEKVLSEALRAPSYLVLLHRSPHAEALAYLIGWRIGDEAELARIAVLAPARKEGLGRQLLHFALQEWQAQGVTRIFLEVRASNIAAQSLYRSCGFVEVGQRPKYYSNGEDALLMARDMV